MIRWALRTTFRLIVLAALALVIVGGILYVNKPEPSGAQGWKLGATMPDARGEVASAMLGGKLYVMGGLKGLASASNDVSVYDVANNAWSRGPKMPIALHHAAAAASGGRVYLSGGARSVRDWTPQTTFLSFDPKSGWERLAPMPEGRQGHAMVAIGPKLYIVGGSGATNRTLVYDTKTSRWTTGAPLSEGRNHLRAVVWHGAIWTLGGRTGELSDRVDVYEIARNTWAPGPTLPEPMSAMAVGVVNDVIHVVGGENPAVVGGEVLHMHFSLSFPAEKWRENAQPALAVHGAGYGSDGRGLILAGGASRPGALSPVSWTDVTQIFTPKVVGM